jgi:hypothetical protein
MSEIPPLTLSEKASLEAGDWVYLQGVIEPDKLAGSICAGKVTLFWEKSPEKTHSFQQSFSLQTKEGTSIEVQLSDEAIYAEKKRSTWGEIEAEDFAAPFKKEAPGPHVTLHHQSAVVRAGEAIALLGRVESFNFSEEGRDLREKAAQRISVVKAHLITTGKVAAEDLQRRLQELHRRRKEDQEKFERDRIALIKKAERYERSVKRKEALFGLLRSPLQFVRDHKHSLLLSLSLLVSLGFLIGAFFFWPDANSRSVFICFACFAASLSFACWCVAHSLPTFRSPFEKVTSEPINENISFFIIFGILGLFFPAMKLLQQGLTLGLVLSAMVGTILFLVAFLLLPSMRNKYAQKISQTILQAPPNANDEVWGSLTGKVASLNQKTQLLSLEVNQEIFEIILPGSICAMPPPNRDEDLFSVSHGMSIIVAGRRNGNRYAATGPESLLVFVTPQGNAAEILADQLRRYLIARGVVFSSFGLLLLTIVLYFVA